MSNSRIPDWVISDTHWNHANINRFCARTTPAFPTQESVEELMRYNWRGLVKPGDKILHLGDLGFFPKDEYVHWLAELPGEKEIVLGNHDKRTSTEWLAQHGFKVIEPPVYEVDGVQVYCDHYAKQDLPKGAVSMAGHFHNNPAHSTPAHLNVSVELWAFAPIPFDYAVKKVVWHMRNGGAGRPRRKR